MDVDVTTLLRLKATVEAAGRSVPDGQEATSASLSESYGRLRDEVALAIPAELNDEFVRLFPDLPATQSRQNDMFRSAAATNHARQLLTQLGGWLDGTVTGAQYEARLRAEAEAYAKERVKAERGRE